MCTRSRLRTKYLPPETLDELILSVERRMEAERALPQSHSPQGHGRATRSGAHQGGAGLLRHRGEG
jgi:hypothetical protein